MLSDLWSFDAYNYVCWYRTFKCKEYMDPAWQFSGCYFRSRTWLKHSPSRKTPHMLIFHVFIIRHMRRLSPYVSYLPSKIPLLVSQRARIDELKQEIGAVVTQTHIYWQPKYFLSPAHMSNNKTTSPIQCKTSRKFSLPSMTDFKLWLLKEEYRRYPHYREIQVYEFIIQTKSIWVLLTLSANYVKLNIQSETSKSADKTK